MTAAIVRGGPGTIDEASLFCIQFQAALCLRVDCGWARGRDHGLLVSTPGRRFARCCSRGVVGCAGPDGREEGPMETGPLQDGAFADSAPQGEAAPDGAAEAREASELRPAGRSRSMPAPSYLTVGSGFPRARVAQRLRLRHFQPADADRGHLHGHARPGAAHGPVRQRGSRVGSVQILSSAPEERTRLRPTARTRAGDASGLNPSSQGTSPRPRPQLRADRAWRRLRSTRVSIARLPHACDG